jgi:uncharacterized membrane protein
VQRIRSARKDDVGRAEAKALITGIGEGVVLNPCHHGYIYMTVLASTVGYFGPSSGSAWGRGFMVLGSLVATRILGSREVSAMEEYLVTSVGYLRLVVEAIGAAVVGFGVLATAIRYVLTLVGVRDYTNNEIRLYLGRYLALGLEFQLSADILSTAVAPTLDDVILLGAIATIRTALNYFLSQELERERRETATSGRDATIA